jgi:hypothetical protein
VDLTVAKISVRVMFCSYPAKSDTIRDLKMHGCQSKELTQEKSKNQFLLEPRKNRAVSQTLINQIVKTSHRRSRPLKTVAHLVM